MNSKCEAYSKVVIKSDTLQNLQFKNWCMLRKFFWNLTRYKMFNSISEAYLKIDAKSDTLENFSSKSDPLCFSFFWTLTSSNCFSIRNLTRSFSSEACFSNQHKNFKTWQFHGLKWTKTWYFDCKHFSKIWQDEKFSIEDITGWKFSQSKIWCVLKYWIQNVTHVQKSDLKSEAVKNVQIEIWRVVKRWDKIWHFKSS